VRFGSKTDLNPDYQTISNMSAIRSNPPVSLLSKSEFQTLIIRMFIEFKLWFFLVTNIK
ncbi:MAG: hypothetical protein ACJAV1_003488, partial [Paraglaciecola sp.]